MAALPDTRMPGVYSIEVPTIPPSIALVPTAVPIFIGYTEKAVKNEEDITLKPTRIRNLREYEAWFGTAPLQQMEVEIHDRSALGAGIFHKVVGIGDFNYRMYYALQLYYANGGGPCYILSVGKDNSGGDPYTPALFNLLKKVKDITILVMPDAVKSSHYNSAVQQSLLHCSTAVNRVVIIDVNDEYGEDNEAITAGFRTVVPAQIDQKKYGAAYYPFLNTSIDFVFSSGTVTIKEHKLYNDANPDGTDGPQKGKTANTFQETDNLLYNQVVEAVRQYPVTLPPSPAIAGLYVTTDLTQGVWKAPANASLASVITPTIEIDDDLHASLNVDATSGKSINAIRAYTGRGMLVFGARTLAGNDLEWRYISVRRTFCFIEDAVGRAMVDFVFSPNNRDTWIKVKAMISNFLNEIWKAGGLFGNTPAEAYQVNVGQPETMTDVDILEGKMIVEIKLRVTRPAEFIILRYEHKFNTTTN